jgi:hypothetical protein
MNVHRLERGELVFYPKCPFPLPTGDDLAFLLAQRRARFSHKDISYCPRTGNVAGFVKCDCAQSDRLARLFADFSSHVSDWLGREFPGYRDALTPDRATFRSEEEATRRLRYLARNDLLHLDAFPNRPSHGRRILRVYVNINPTEPRVWVTSEPFAKLLERYAADVGLTLPHAMGLLQRVLYAFNPTVPARSSYDAFMLRFHDFLKESEMFQERGPRRLWRFPPGSAWVAMTDACSHGELRGRYALEHSFFVPVEALALPDESPAAVLARANQPIFSRAA